MYFFSVKIADGTARDSSKTERRIAVPDSYDLYRFGGFIADVFEIAFSPRFSFSIGRYTYAGTDACQTTLFGLVCENKLRVGRTFTFQLESANKWDFEILMDEEKLERTTIPYVLESSKPRVLPWFLMDQSDLEKIGLEHYDDFGMADDDFFFEDDDDDFDFGEEDEVGY